MITQGLPKDRRFLLVASLMLVFLVILAAEKIFLVRDPQTIAMLNDGASVASALVATVLFINFWLFTGGRASTAIWGWFVIGMLLWTFAEAIWGYFEVALGQEVPYPSVADVFWLLGYAAFSVALLIQFRSFRALPSGRQWALIALFTSVFVLIIAALVIGPIIEGFDPGQVLASLLNIAYPLSDLVLLTLTLAIIFSLEQGRFAFSWRLLGLGLVFMSAADLLWSYADWNGLYAPESGLNIITLLVDMLYPAAYLTLGLGAYSYSITTRSIQSTPIRAGLRSLAKSTILLFVNREGCIITASDNFIDLVRAPSPAYYADMPLSQALQIDAAAFKPVWARMLGQRSVGAHSLSVRDLENQAREVWMTTFPVVDEEKQLVSIAVILRTTLDAESLQQRPLSAEQKMLSDYYLERSGVLGGEKDELLKAYFIEQISLLYSLIHQFNGAPHADRFLASLEHLAGQKGWHFSFSSREITIPMEYQGEVLANMLASLLGAARRSAVELTNSRMVEREVQILEGNLGAEDIQYLDKYGLRQMPVQPA